MKRLGGRWTRHSTVDREGAKGRAHPTTPPLHVSRDGASTSLDASALLRPGGSGLSLVRRVESRGREASVTWELRNGGAEPLVIGAFGASLPFNQMFSARSLADVAAHCSFTDVYLGGGAGYVQARGL